MKGAQALGLYIKSEVARWGYITPDCLALMRRSHMKRADFEAAVRAGLALHEQNAGRRRAA
ncbi:hypothetical protein GCM10027275_22720 [Rhabdobacter roseus]|uniref:Uncharacterized protein n=1 Tax=Rhabdobacter roseus TaxID=1655419 RepID=A0A840TX39_9BACT|nr:hypothetical protein [Rhabdobacter roseus]MBB5284209.1 hypothetical protein [Rhabdobacter roseus]